MRRRLAAVVLATLAVPGTASAWGDEGHRVVALIARGVRHTTDL